MSDPRITDEAVRIAWVAFSASMGKNHGVAQHVRAALEAAVPHLAPQPVLDRDAINHALNLHWWDEDEHPCACGFDFIAAGQSFKMHLAAVLDALLNGGAPS